MTMKISKVKQGSIDWLNARHGRIGASEAFAIMRHYATAAEWLAAGVQPEDVMPEYPESETPFESAYAIYQRIVNDFHLPNISIWDDEFGKAVESWVKAQFDIAPKSTVYMSKTRICSLDAHNGGGDNPWAIPAGAVLEIKSRRGQLEDKTPIKWRIQNALQCQAVGNPDGYILRVALDDWSENMRGAVAKMYQMLPRKRFYSWFSGLGKKISLVPNPMDSRLMALFDVCEMRFWTDVKSKTAPIPIIAEEKSRKCVNELLGSYSGTGAYDLRRFKKLNNLAALIKNESDKEKQKIFVHCIHNKCIAVMGDGTVATWDGAGALRTKVAK